MSTTAILRKRDRQTFDWLYSQHASVLFGIIRKMVKESATAEILLQETFVTAWKSLDGFDSTPDGLLTWMLQIARARVNEHLRNNNCDDPDRASYKESVGTTVHQQSKEAIF